MRLVLNVGTSPGSIVAVTHFESRDSCPYLNLDHDKFGSFTIDLVDFLALYKEVLKALFLQEKLIPYIRYYIRFQSVNLLMLNTFEGFTTYGYTELIAENLTGHNIDNLRQIIILTVQIALSKPGKKQSVKLEHSSIKEVKFTLPMPFNIFIGELSISLHDFLVIADAIFHSADPFPNDPREKFLQEVKQWEYFKLNP